MEVIVKALEVDGVLDADAVSRRLLCFGVDGASAFQGNRNGVTQQIQTKSLWKVHHYFCKSPKRLLEYQKLAEVMEMKGLQPLLQVTTRWASLLDPLQRLLAEYQMLLNKLHTDKADNDATEKRDVYICDFVAALKIYEGELYSLYAHKGIAFASDEFWAFCNLLDCSHEQIHMKWMADLNDNTANLVFVANGDKS